MSERSLSLILQRHADRVIPFTYSETADLARVSVRQLMRWVRAGRVPSPVYQGTVALFPRHVVESILDGPKAVGTFTPAHSPRSTTARRAGPKGKRGTTKKGKRK